MIKEMKKQPEKPSIETLEQQALEFSRALGFQPFCPHCKTQMEDDFCTGCGYELNNVTPEDKKRK